MNKQDDLVFAALGGAGEIGMNMYLYGHGHGSKRRWIMVDCGVGFGDMETSPGIDLVMADPTFIAAQADKLDGIFITHAHEDHIGGLGHLWPRLKAKIYAQPFTAAHIIRKMEENGLSPKAVRIVEKDEVIKAGPFKVRFQPITHSIPEAAALVIDTPSGRILHTGDFKVDPDPQMGAGFDFDAFRKIGEEGVHCLVCDSTNVMVEGRGHSEREVLDPLAEIMRNAKGAVAATTFASNVARVRGLALMGRQCGRQIVLVGRAMKRMVEVSQQLGLLTDFPGLTSEDDAESLAPSKVLYIVTGSQGESRAALARIASGSHPTVELKDGDTVIFSSKTIPGNEEGVYRLYNQLSERGVTVFDEDNGGRIHVSGHARRGDIEAMYDLIKPKISIPMHGEHRHLMSHKALAEELGVPSIVAANGAIAAIAGDRPVIVDHAAVGRLFLDGHTLVGALDGVVRDRLKLARNGLVIASIVVDEHGVLVADPEVKILGGPAEHVGWPEPLEDMIWDAIDSDIEKANRKQRTDDGLEGVALRAIRRVCRRWWGKKPHVEVLITRLED
jgi:ribonuclease J